MSSLSEQAVRDMLARYVPAEAVTAVTVRGGEVACVLSLEGLNKPPQPLQRACERALLSLDGAQSVRVIITAHRDSPPQGDGAPRKAAQWRSDPVPAVKRIVAVASGKGGVGKSTTTMLLAHALIRQGKRVGVLDADIAGPSIPRMLGLQQAGQPAFENGQMIPHHAHGMQAMSMGFLTGDQAAVMRGSMVSKVLAQMLRQVRWATKDAPLDILLVDMPPGTNDIAISMVQQVPLDGVVIVTTPQEMAVMDARKCAQMMDKVSVPILGVIENMSYFTDPSGNRHRLFGEGGGKALADEFAVAYLGECPLDPSVGAALERGETPSLTDTIQALAERVGQL